MTEKINDDWLRGETRRQTGVFPCNFVDISMDIINQLPVTVAKAAAAENGESAPTDSERVLYCKGMFDYNSDVPSDLSFNTGDVIKVRKKVGDEWIEGELNGRVGMFPAAYVEIMEDTLGGQRGGCFNALPRINLFFPKISNDVDLLHSIVILASIYTLDSKQSFFCSRIVETNAYVELSVAEAAGRKYRGRWVE